ncbi:3-methyl-2-oxobutanoate hydroxymethyltransferase [Polymorphum gilvum]|uniref:3-methyl-2-oxobutanoate hydroxymethyltransferase n=1 Tax=Polymorphum gilvum TaxID=991904 RepID=UPI00059B9E28|nr:3-methyl-2-oxobutanoate hydroxymethyltransferase [Polymorphum gilvum]
MARTTLSTLDRIKAQGERFAVLTAYDASFAAMMGPAGISVVLVGDSLGMVVQGRGATTPVTLDEMVYHTHCVARGIGEGAADAPLIMADLPFMTYATPQDAARSAAALMRAGASVVKLEGGAWLADTVCFLAERGIPVCAHLGLTPQTTDMLGGYKVQGKTDESAARIVSEATLLDAAGARLVLLECVPDAVGRAVRETVAAPLIGIGAGPHTDAQVLVLHDMLGLSPGRKARFVKNYLAGRDSAQAAIAAFAEDVRSGAYPAPEHCYG